MKKSSKLALLVVLLTMMATTAWCAPTLRIIGQEPVCELRGEDLQGVGALDVTVGYDPAGLTNPRITQQSLSAGAIVMPYLTTPGAARVLILAPPQGITGSGSLLQFAFDSLGGTAVKITTLTVKMVSAATQKDIPVQTSVEVTAGPDVTPSTTVNQSPTTVGNLTDNSTGQSKGDKSTGTTSTSTSNSASGSNYTGTGQTVESSSTFTSLKAALTGQTTISSVSSGVNVVAVANPETVTDNKQQAGVVSESGASTEAGMQPRGDETPQPQPEPIVEITDDHAPPMTASVTDSPVASLSADSQPGNDVAVQKRTSLRTEVKGSLPSVDHAKETGKVSVLSLFKDYKGPRTPTTLTALFSRGGTPGVSQKPPIALSDGVSTVTLTVEYDDPTSPNFSVTGGKLLTLKREGKRYLLNIVPYVRTLEVSVSLLVGKSLTTMPLIVVPPLELKTLLPSGKLDEAAFATLLKRNSGASGAASDNAAGDYQDDYVLTAHYLLQNSKK